ncbi:MAG: peptidoglycan bridge formation glycyltransferase FemA/FemB family protein [Anaerolineae bacterium]|nr:peptidoglycan bridge formation glycyltransferase FemA/FemB family protein [Anaerolineae bacterium]
MLRQQEIHDRADWNARLRNLSGAHVLQTWEWGEFKRVTTGWQPLRLALLQGKQTVAMVSIGMRRHGPLRVMYAPRGPILAWEDATLRAAVLEHLQGITRRHGALWLKIDPDLPLASGLPGAVEDRPHPPGQALVQELGARGWRLSADQVQFRNSIQIDLSASEDELLASFSPNTRRKIRLAERREVQVRVAGVDDLDMLYGLYRITGARDGFLIRPAAYYRQAWGDFLQAGLAQAMIAEYRGVPLAQVILFHFGERCFYFYGASTNEQRQRLPNHLLQWEAIRWARAQGYRLYDLWGAPDVFDESDPLWGVYGFKRGFRGRITRGVGAWDYAPSPLFYRLWNAAWPRLQRLRRLR